MYRLPAVLYIHNNVYSTVILSNEAPLWYAEEDLLWADQTWTTKMRPLNGLDGTVKALSGIISNMHSAGLIHSELKPQNILLAAVMPDLAASPTLWVSDFGSYDAGHEDNTLSPAGEGSPYGTWGVHGS
eukprot:gb/GECG01013073.1/.p1 GENE.gb/GECG01013073.1/~~gb/GECG01013073.1/.p1  ORF type:complete len:129 (+),score=9.48 gb/GECG01013073.1/:1-387(+)